MRNIFFKSCLKISSKIYSKFTVVYLKRLQEFKDHMIKVGYVKPVHWPNE